MNVILIVSCLAIVTVVCIARQVTLSSVVTSDSPVNVVPYISSIRGATTLLLKLVIECVCRSVPLTYTIVKLAPKSVIFPFEASTFQLPERTYCGSAVVILLITRELILPVALKFPVEFVRKKTKAGSVPDVVFPVVVAFIGLIVRWPRWFRPETKSNKDIVKTKVKEC